jgi:hypothetical protein
MRVPQSQGQVGSLKWIQQAVNEHWPSLDQPILQKTGGDAITWLSPLRADEFAEYRDGSFLERIDKAELEPALTKFWPRRGPQWDALGKLTTRGDILLVEAKAHIAEMCSSPTAASPASLSTIETTLNEVARALNAKSSRAAWTKFFFQIANRLAHLHFLRTNHVASWLVFVNFLGDKDKGGPTTPEAWEAAYEVAFHVMGLRKDHPLSQFIVHVYPNVGRDRAKP